MKMVFDFNGTEDSPELIKKIDEESCDQASENILSAFIWEDSKEGHDFWFYVSERLLEIGRKGEEEKGLDSSKKPCDNVVSMPRK